MRQYNHIGKKLSTKVLSLCIAAGCCVSAAPLLTMAYTVQKGDTLTSICGSYEEALEVAEANGIENPDLIYVGQEIALPDDIQEVVDANAEAAAEEAAASTSAGANLVSEAESLKGIRYVWGGSSTSGFDCSGFVCYAINHSGNGWNVGRTNANGLRSYCTKISKDELQPGDIIFFQGTYSTSGASHLGIYIGDGQMIHCSTSKGVTVTSINSSYWQNHYLECGRLNL